MLVYTRVRDEAAPEAFVLADDDPTVADLVAEVSASRSAQGRLIELDLDGVVPSAKLRDLGVNDGDLITVRAIGEPKPDTTPTVKPQLDVDALQYSSSSKRLSEYEALTRFTQWKAPYHIEGETPRLKVWSDDSTLLRCSDWDSYRAPDKLYYRTYTTRQARAGRSVATAFDFAQKDKQLAGVDPARVDLLRNIVGVLQYPDWGLCIVNQLTTRFALSSWIAGATSFAMFDELRHAQLYGRLALAYSEHHDGFDDPRPAWMESARFQPTRRIIEELLATLDWGKAIVLANLVVEPLITAAAHSLLTTGSLAAGDGLTPFVCRSMEDDKVRHRESAVAFLRLLTDDPAHAEHNRALVSEWIADLLPQAYAAAVALLDHDTASDADEALAEAAIWITTQFADAGIDVPAVGLTNLEVVK